MLRLTFLRGIVGAVLMVLALTACSASGTDQPATGAETRTVAHALGTSEIPVAPKRIVVLDSNFVLDNVVALGFGDSIVGRVDLSGTGEKPPSWLVGKVDFDAITFLGAAYPDGVNLEKLAALKPDLVIGVGSAFGKQYRAISKIAPSVAPVAAEGYVVGPWQDLTRATAKVLGRQAEGEKLVKDVEDHLTQRLASLPSGSTKKSLTVINAWNGKPPLFFGASDEVLWIYRQAGYTLNPGFGETTYEMLTPELYAKVDAKIIMVNNLTHGALNVRELFAKDPVLSATQAFQANNVRVIEDGLLATSSGPLGMRKAVDVIVEQLSTAS